jgi:hypothetical protein
MSSKPNSNSNKQSTQPIQPSQDTYSQNIFHWAQTGGNITQDLGRAIFGFIPDGLIMIYDEGLKNLPIIGSVFQAHMVETVVKFPLNLLQGLSADCAKFLIKPIGFMLGTFLGSLFSSKFSRLPDYKGQIGKFIQKVSGQTLAGGLFGLLLLMILPSIHSTFHFIKLTLPFLLIAIGGGAILGLSFKATMLFAMQAVEAANAASSRMNARRAQKLCDILKKRTEVKTKDFVHFQVTSVLNQYHGEAARGYIDAFWHDNIEKLLQHPYKKIERHLAYLSDRAISGDLKSLRKLFKLYREEGEENKLETLLKRILNERESFKIKEDTDKFFDQWYYQSLRRL